jgi:hypothetical protein
MAAALSAKERCKSGEREREALRTQAGNEVEEWREGKRG